MPAPGGQVALVTGAAQGLGAATARRLAGEGARVAVNDIAGDERLERLATELGGMCAPADISDRTQMAAICEQVARRLGDIQLLVCNAAVMDMEPFGSHDQDRWWRQIEVNLTGTYNTIQAALPGMLRSGSGRIVIVASEWGVTGWPNASGYCSSKAGLIALTKSLGRELASRGIGVNAVAPGVIDTPQLDHDAADAGVTAAEIRRRYAAAAPQERIASAEEIAATIAFLCSPGAAAIVGQILQPNGGTTRGPG
ncbi:MAG: SDR family NAD(P)-dependent oxidoreductase [Solirubrobacterales bacterium]